MRQKLRNIILIIYISGPPYVPVLGSSLYLLRKHTHIPMAGEWRQKYGPVVGFITAVRNVVAVCGPHEVLEVLHREEFQARPFSKFFSDRSFGKRLGNGTFALFILTGLHSETQTCKPFTRCNLVLLSYNKQQT